MKKTFSLLLLFACCLHSYAQQAVSSQSTGDNPMGNLLSSRKYYEGYSYRNGSTGGDAFQIRFKEYNPSKNEYSGEIKWRISGDTDNIWGKVNGNKIAFYQYMRQSTEMLTVVSMALEGNNKMSGTWTGKGRFEGQKGTLYFALENQTNTDHNKPAKVTAPANSNTAPAPAVSANSIVGTYYGNGTGYQVATGTIELKENGTYIRKNGNQIRTGRYSVKGNKVYFEGELKAWNNGEAEIHGNNMRFSWLMDGVVIQLLFRKA